MSHTYWKVEHNKFANNTWSAVTTVLDDVYDPSVITNLGDGRDSFKFNLLNRYRQYDNFFGPNDKLTIYRVANTSTVSTSDIIMIGSLKDIPQEVTGQQNQVRLEGFNFSETLMGAIVFADPQGQVIPVALQTALEEANSQNSNFVVTWHPDNPSVRTDGSAFPTVQEYWRNKTLLSILEKYSSNRLTGDGAYHWYVNNANQLVWRNRNQGSIYTFNSATDTHTSLKTSVDTKGIKNYFILKGGRDAANNPIQTYYPNQPSINKYGRKYQFVPDYAILSETLIKADLIKAYGEEAAKSINTKYPVTASSFTTSWNSNISTTVSVGANNVVMTRGSLVTINSGVEATNQKLYNLALKTHIKSMLIDLAKVLAGQLEYGKLKIDLEFAAGTKPWIVGDRIFCDIPEKGYTNKELRVNEINYSEQYDTFSLEEDIPSV